MDERLTRTFHYKGYHFTGFRLPLNSTVPVGQILWRGIAQTDDGNEIDIFFRLFVALHEEGEKVGFRKAMSLAEAKIEAARMKADAMKREVEEKLLIHYDEETWSIDEEVAKIPAHDIRIKSIRWIDDYENGELSSTWGTEKMP
jgi:hypothetical protein